MAILRPLVFSVPVVLFVGLFRTAPAQTPVGSPEPYRAASIPTRADRSEQISEYVREIFQDREGNLWFGTNSDGVCCFDGIALRYLDARHGFPGRAVRGIAQADDGAMWFATERGVSRFDAGMFTNYSVENGLTDNDTWSMMRDRAGTIWVGTRRGVCRLEGERFVPFSIPAAEVDKPESRFDPKLVWSMFEDSSGNVWFGTDGEGARRYDGKTFTTYTTKDGLAGNQVRCILGDRKGRIWLGTEGGGVSCFDGGEFRTFTAKDGLNNDRIFGILEDRAGILWFSTLGDGVSRYDGTSFTPLRENAGVTRNHVQSMLQAKDGKLWFGFSGGLFRLEGTTFVNVKRGGPWK